MLRTIIEKLIDRLDMHNRSIVSGENLVNEHKIDMLFEILEANKVKVAVEVKNPATGEIVKHDIDKDRLLTLWSAWRYVSVQFDVSRLSRVNQPLFGEMAYSTYKWILRDGVVIFELTKGF